VNPDVKQKIPDKKENFAVVKFALILVAKACILIKRLITGKTADR